MKILSTFCKEKNSIIFSAPVDGVYYLTVHILGDQQEEVTCLLRVDGQRRAFTKQLYSGEVDEVTDIAAVMSILLPLNAGQTVDVENNLQTMVHGSSGELYSWFAGYLLRAT